MSARRGARAVYLDEISSKDFARLVKDDPVAVVPVGSLEEHGEHLPLGTDSMQAEEVARRLAQEIGALILPPIGYGECRSTRNFPGTVSLSFETVQMLAFDIVSELRRNGLRKIVILSGHAGSGHMAALRLGAQRAVEQNPDIKVMVLSDYDIAYDLRGKEFPDDDGHAGRIETSRMLNIRPELVGDARPRGKARPPRFMVLPDPEEYFPTGVMGDSSGSSAECGRRIDDYVVDNLVSLVKANLCDGRKVRKRKGA